MQPSRTTSPALAFVVPRHRQCHFFCAVICTKSQAQNNLSYFIGQVLVSMVASHLCFGPNLPDGSTDTHRTQETTGLNSLLPRWVYFAAAWRPASMASSCSRPR